MIKSVNSFNMATIIILLVLLASASFIAATASTTFKGSSSTMYMLLNIAGVFGYLAFFAFIIWGFFKFPWWVPVVSLVVPFLIAGLIVPLTRMVFPRIISVVMVPVLIVWILSYYL